VRDRKSALKRDGGIKKVKGLRIGFGSLGREDFFYSPSFHLAFLQIEHLDLDGLLLA